MIKGVDDSRLSAIGEMSLNERENSGNQRKRLPVMFATSAPHTTTTFSELESRALAAFFVSQRCLEADSVSCPKGMGEAVNAGIGTFVHASGVWDPSTTQHLSTAVPLHSTDSHPPRKTVDVCAWERKDWERKDVKKVGASDERRRLVVERGRSESCGKLANFSIQTQMLRTTLTVEIITRRLSRQRRALSDVTSLILSKHLSPSGTSVVFAGQNG